MVLLVVCRLDWSKSQSVCLENLTKESDDNLRAVSCNVCVSKIVSSIT